jgi:glucuronokinase
MAPRDSEFNFRELQPQFILEVEVGELNINAGLQDRVVQVYEGLVYMF